jgi:histone deacetylase complex regulatory component SIN3
MSIETQQKKRIVNDKEVLEFLHFIEDKLEDHPEKIEKFLEIFDGYFNKSIPEEEEVLYEIKDSLNEFPVIFYEFNKILPKSFKIVFFLLKV